MSFYYNEPRAGRITWSIVLGLVVLIALISLATAVKKVPRDQIGLSYGGGIFEGQHFQGIHQPGSSLFVNGVGDKLYMYPVTQRNYIISKQKGEGDRGTTDFIPAPSQDRIEVDFEVAAYFKLNLGKIQKFHEQIGLKYAAWTSDGWNRMLNDSFRQQIENTLQEEARKYPVASIYADPATLLQIQTEVGQALPGRVAAVLGDDYFCGPTYVGGGNCPDLTFVIKRVTLPPDVVTSYQAIKVSENKIQVRQNEVKQAELQAQAITELNAALEKAGNSEAYVLLKAIESGKITFWVLPSNSGLNIVKAGP